MNRTFHVERDCGCYGRSIWRWTVVARIPGEHTNHVDDTGIVVALAITKWGAERKARRGPELLELRYREIARHQGDIHI